MACAEGLCPHSASTSACSSLAGDLGFDFDALDSLEEAFGTLEQAQNGEPIEGGAEAPVPGDAFATASKERRPLLILPRGPSPLKSVKSLGFDLPPPPESPVRTRSVPKHWRLNHLEPPTPLRRCRSDHAGPLFPQLSEESRETSPASTASTAGPVDSPGEPTGLKVGVVVSGSRGDVQPHVSLALELRRYGHEVRLFTNSNHSALCSRHGVDMVPVFADTQSCIERIGGVSGDGLLGSLRSVSRAQRAAKQWFQENPGSCTALEDALEDFHPDALLTTNEAATAALRYEMQTGTPTLFACFFRAMLDFQSSMLHLQPPRPAFLAASSLLDEAPAAESAECLVQTGPWVLEDQPTEAEVAEGGSLAALRAFLDGGRPPVVVCWGSMIPEGMEPLAMLRLALSALSSAGRRGVIVGGYARLHELGEQLLAGALPEEAELMEFAQGSVCFVADVPHAWLLPRSSCLVHHGGAGTVQTALRIGVPSVVTPVFADQFENAAAVERLGAGVGFVQALSEVFAVDLAAALVEAETRAPRARELAEELRESDGTKQAAWRIDDFLRGEVAEGRFARQAAEIRKKKA